MLRLSNNRAKKNNWTMSLRKKCTVFKYNQIFILNNILQTNKQVVNCTILKHDIVGKNMYVQWNSLMMGVTETFKSAFSSN